MSKDFSKKKHNLVMVMLSFFKYEKGKVRLISATVSQNGQHIGRHCHCDNVKLNSDHLHLLHDITSSELDLGSRQNALLEEQ